MSDKNNPHYYKSANLKDDENINMVDRFILLCLMFGIKGEDDISTISIDKISEYCSYTDSTGKIHPFGRNRIKESLNRLQDAGRIKILFPNKQGQCTKYKVLLPDHYEKVSMDFCKKNLSPEAKGYILCSLQHNQNKDVETHQPNNIDTLTQYNVDIMKDKYHDSVGRIRRAEQELASKGYLTLQDTNKRYSNHLPVVERIVHLDRLSLDQFVVQSILSQQEQIEEIKDNMITKDDLDVYIEEYLKRKGLHIVPTPISYEF